MTEQVKFLGRTIGQINNLVLGVATAPGRVMSLATVGSPHMWLGFTALQRKDREDRPAPMTPDGLFGSLSFVTQCFKRLEEEKVQLSHHLPLAPSSNQRGDEVQRDGEEERVQAG